MSTPAKPSQEEIINSYNFPANLNVKIVNKAIEFALPINIPNTVKDSFLQQPFRKNNNTMIISQKPKANKVYILKGGSDFEAKVEALLYILRTCTVDDKPIFVPSRYPLPNINFRFLGEGISSDFSEDEIKSKLIIDISQNCESNITDKSLFDKNPCELTTEEVYLLVSIFNQSQVKLISGLRQDENHDPQIFQLNIPVTVSVLIQYIDFDKYKISFADNEPIKAEQIHKQLIECALPKIKSTECILATFSKTDPIDSNFLRSELKNAVIVLIPDERTAEEECAITYVEVFDTELDKNEIEQVLNKCFETVKLAVCSKCKLFFCPSQNEICYRYFHRGKQIKFESGQWEEIDEDEEEEPITLVNYSCCGECIKDEPPMNCGKEAQGNHIVDTKEGIISKLSVEKSRPGNIKLTH